MFFKVNFAFYIFVIAVSTSAHAFYDNCLNQANICNQKCTQMPVQDTCSKQCQQKLHICNNSTMVGFLGITISSLDNKEISVINILPYSPANYAGIQTHDVIISVDKKHLNPQEFLNYIKQKPGEYIYLKINRFGSVFEGYIRLGSKYN